MKFSSLLIVVILFLASCKQTDNIKTRPNTDYYSLKAGKYFIYNADSIKYPSNNTTPPDTISYQLKDSIQLSYKDIGGQVVYRIMEYRRKNVNSLWQISRIFSRFSNSQYSEETDGNLSYVKLIYPVSQFATWNPNKYNTTDTPHVYNSQYIEVHVPYSLPGLKFDSTILVQIQHDSNLVNNFVYKERYAANIGLIIIQRDSFWNVIQSPNPTYQSGFRYKQTLVDFGPR